MGNEFEKLLGSSIADIKKGYTEEDESYICLLCGRSIEKGVVYRCEEQLYEAEKYMKIHIGKEHGSVFEYLIGLDKKVTGLSDHQSSLMKLFYQGMSDAGIQKEMDIGSSSTVRNHRFVLKEKEKQAKLFLVLMELLRENGKKESTYVKPHKTAKMVDDRYKVTTLEKEKILKKYFSKGLNGPITTFHMKEKSKLVVLGQIVNRFKPKKIYSEKEVNEILKTANEDFVTLRRYLIEYGFMTRKADGSQYWIVEAPDVKEEKDMDRKKELIKQYKEMKIEAGVYQIKNTVNGKVFIASPPTLKTIHGRLPMLRGGSHFNKKLQQEWNEYGENAFVIEVLEVLEEPEEGFFDKKDELKRLEKKWMEKLQPFGENGYNTESTR